MGQLFQILTLSAQKLHSAGGKGGSLFFPGVESLFFCYIGNHAIPQLGAHATFHNPRKTRIRPEPEITAGTGTGITVLMS